jgi:type II secretory pathway component GspD/PulD (secretin)
LLLSFLAHAQDDTSIPISLPASCELERLTELVSQATGASVTWSAGKIQGNVRLSLPNGVSATELWCFYNQVLTAQGLTTIIGAMPGIFQVVPVAEAAQASPLMTREEFQALPMKPGFATVVTHTQHISAESAVKSLVIVLPIQGAQFRSLGGDGRSLLVSAPSSALRVVDNLLARLDGQGQTPGVRLVRPERTAPTTLQAAAAAAWSALARVDERTRVGEIQVAPDGVQLLLIASDHELDVLEKLVRDLDKSEPVETRSYRPKYFTLDEVASLVQQTLGALHKIETLRDRLTGSLVITATTAEHQRIAALVSSLDEAPATARRQARTMQVKHRKAEEMAHLLMGLITAGYADGSSGATKTVGSTEPSDGFSQPSVTVTPAASQPPTPQQPPSSPFAAGKLDGGQLSLGSGTISNAPRRTRDVSTVSVTTVSTDGTLVITADPVTNRLLVLGEPRIIDQAKELLEQVDQRQPQVDVEVVLLGMTASEDRELGVELARQFNTGDTQGGWTTLFGISQASGGDPTNRTAATSGGLGAVVLKPGQYAAVLKAVEQIKSGKTVIRSQLIIANNSQATLNAVTQKAYSATNSGSQVATTSYGGTSDAGTQITLEPRISAADYVTLDYNIVQSSFSGSSNGVLPPDKISNNVTSTATVPDSYTIALGGLSSQNQGHAESRVPWLGSIPWIGNLFKDQTDGQDSQKFYVFIRASILRHSSFADLRYRAIAPLTEAGLGNNGDPVLLPTLMR